MSFMETTGREGTAGTGVQSHQLYTIALIYHAGLEIKVFGTRHQIV